MWVEKLVNVLLIGQKRVPDAVSSTIGHVLSARPIYLVQQASEFGFASVLLRCLAESLNRQTRTRSYEWKSVNNFLIFHSGVKNKWSYSCSKMFGVCFVWKLVSSTIFSKSFMRSSSIWSCAAKCAFTKQTDTPYNLKRMLTAPLLPCAT